MSVAGVPTRKIKKALSEHGYVKDRCNDGHEIWEKQITKSVSIPIHSKAKYEINVTAMNMRSMIRSVVDMVALKF